MRSFAVILLAVLGTGVALAGAAGYLPRIGPAALRVQPPASFAARANLPPLPMGDLLGEPLPPTIETTAPPSASVEPARLAPETHEVGSALPGGADGATTDAPGSPPGLPGATTPLISPQMLLRFFLPGEAGNSREAVIVTPPVFSPARPPTPGSSSATYTSPQR